MKNCYLVSVLFVTLFLLNSCEKEGKNTPDPETEYVTYKADKGEIGYGGGEITIANPNSDLYGTKIVIPEGALDETVDVDISQSDNHFYLDSSALSISFSPNGLIFNKPVEISIPVQGELTNDHKLFFFDPDSNIIEQMPVKYYDIENGVIKGYTDHFSIYTATKNYVKIDADLYKLNGKIAAKIKILGTKNNIGLKYVPTSLGIQLTGGAFNAWDIIKDDDLMNPVYSVFTLELCKDGFFNSSLDFQGFFIKRYSPYSAPRNFVVEVYKGSSPLSSNIELVHTERLIYNNDLVLETSRNGLGNWMSGDPFTVVFENVEPNSNSKYFLKIEWKLGIENFGYHTPFYKLNTLDYSKRWSDFESLTDEIEPFNISDDYQTQETPKIPEAKFSASSTSIKAGSSVQFTDQSTNTPTSWSWDFGDGGSSIAQNPRHTYNAVGTYTVKLSASNNYGSDTETRVNYITVNAAGSTPVADFTANTTSITAGSSVQFTDQSTNTPTSWSWDFGDGGSSTAQNPTHKYNAVGTYTVKLTASNNYGSDTETRVNYITVNASGTAPIASFVANTTSIAEGGSVQFTDQSTNSPTSWSWDFGDGGSSQAQNPTHTYTTSGTYTVSLTATNSYGSDTETKTGYITVSTSGGTNETGSFTDSRDGRSYQTVKIGNQWWMAENLAWLPEVSPSSSESYTSPYYYVYGYQGTSVSAAKATSNYSRYGALYNYPAALTACPAGWHLPSDEEWKTLEMALGMSQEVANSSGWRGTDEGSQLAGNASLWTDGALENNAAFGSSGFTAVPGGYRLFNGLFLLIGYYGFWWSATESSSSGAWNRTLGYYASSVYRGDYYKGDGFSVRCLRDD